MRILAIAISALGICAALSAPKFAHACDGDKSHEKKKNPSALSILSCDGDKAKNEKKNPTVLSLSTVSCDGDKAKNEKSDKKM